MTEQEQIEVWRKDFSKAIGHNYTVRSDGRYVDVQIDNVWQGFLMAKRSMPVIELPDNSKEDIGGFDCFDKDTVFKAITAAGYQYKIKGE